jgi:hypothetical protein
MPTQPIPPHVHTVDCRNENTLTFLTCWWWKGIHPYVHTHTDWILEKKYPHVHTAGGGKVYTQI